MNGAYSKTKGRGQRRRNIEVQQKTKLEDMEYSREVKPSFNLSRSFLEAQVRSKLNDSEARLTQSTSEGKVHLEIQKESLSILLDQLQEQKEDKWSRDKELMQSEIRRLKAQLEETQAKHVNSSQADIETLKVQLRKISMMLRNTQSELEQQTTTSKDRHVKLEQVKGENEALQNEIEAMKLELRVEKQLRAVAENNVETTIHCLKVQLFDKDTAEFEARSKAEGLETDLAFERAQAEKLQKKLSKMEEALLKQKEDAKKTVERSQASHRAQLEERRAETRKISSALKNAEGLLDIERLCLQQEKISLQKEMDKSRAFYVAQLDEKSEENNTLVAALKKVEQQLESHLIEWQEDKSSLLHATDGHKKTLQDKEQEWQEDKSSLLHATDGLKKTLQDKEQEWQEDKSSLLLATEGFKSQKNAGLLEIERLQQEKTSLQKEMDKSRAFYVAQLDEKIEENNTLVAALKKVDQQLESHLIECQEDKSSLLLATEGLKNTLQEKEQEWQETERSARSQLEDLESQLAKKKKKKKWYRRFFC